MEIEDIQELMVENLNNFTTELNRIDLITNAQNKINALQTMLAKDNKLFKTANDLIVNYNSTLKELPDKEAKQFKEVYLDHKSDVIV